MVNIDANKLICFLAVSGQCHWQEEMTPFSTWALTTQTISAALWYCKEITTALYLV